MTLSVDEAFEQMLDWEETRLPEQVSSVLRDADDVDDRLIAILEDPEHRANYPALHAVRLLGARRATAGAGPIARLVAEFSNENDIINDHGVHALARMGPEALEPVLDVVEEVPPPERPQQLRTHLVDSFNRTSPRPSRTKSSRCSTRSTS